MLAFPYLACAIFAMGASGLSLATNNNYGQNRSAAAFMVVSGITGAQEFCLSAESGKKFVRPGVLCFY